MEGVPELPEAASDFRTRAQGALDGVARVLPGLSATALLAFVAFATAGYVESAFLGERGAPLPASLFAILLGLVLRNAIGLPASYDAGVSFGLKRVLRLGVAMLGLRLSVGLVGSIGLTALPIVVVGNRHGLRGRRRHDAAAGPVVASWELSSPWVPPSAETAPSRPMAPPSTPRRTRSAMRWAA